MRHLCYSQWDTGSKRGSNASENGRKHARSIGFLVERMLTTNLHEALDDWLGKLKQQAEARDGQ
jgi:uncharacterized protein with NRDE domain